MKTFTEWLKLKEAEDNPPIGQSSYEVQPTTYTPRKRNMAPWALPDWVPDWAKEQELEKSPEVQKYKDSLRGSGLSGPYTPQKATRIHNQAPETQDMPNVMPSQGPRGNERSSYAWGGRADQTRSLEDPRLFGSRPTQNQESPPQK